MLLFGCVHLSLSLIDLIDDLSHRLIPDPSISPNCMTTLLLPYDSSSLSSSFFFRFATLFLFSRLWIADKWSFISCMRCSVLFLLPRLFLSLWSICVERAFISEVRHSTSAALFENGTLPLWVRIGPFRTLASHLSMRCEAHVASRGWVAETRKMPDYPVFHLIPISVHKSYICLSCCEFSSNMFTFQQHHFVRSQSRQSLLGATWLKGSSHCL